MNNFLASLSQGNYNLTNEALSFFVKQEQKIPQESFYKPVHAALYISSTFVVASANLADILAQTIYTLGKLVPAIFISIGNLFNEKPYFEDWTLSKVFVHLKKIPEHLLKLIPIATMTLFAGPSFALAYSQKNEIQSQSNTIKMLESEKKALENNLNKANELIAKLKSEIEKLHNSQNPQNTALDNKPMKKGVTPPPPPTGKCPKVRGQTTIQIGKKGSSEKSQLKKQQDKKEEKPQGLALSSQDLGDARKRLRQTPPSANAPSQKNRATEKTEDK